MAAKQLTLDGNPVSDEEGDTILQAATDAGIQIPTLCHLEGVYDIGACRLCLVEVTGVNKLLPACTTCHDSHGVQTVPRLINFNPDYVTPSSNGRLEYISLGSRRGNCSLTCHGEDHRATPYAP